MSGEGVEEEGGAIFGREPAEGRARIRRRREIGRWGVGSSSIEPGRVGGATVTFEPGARTETRCSPGAATSGFSSPQRVGPRPVKLLAAELGYANFVKWSESSGADRYRRGLYIFLQRTAAYPLLMNFDVPDRTVSCARRETSNTPLQPLNLMNDPVFVEAAEAEDPNPDQGLFSSPLSSSNGKRNNFPK